MDASWTYMLCQGIFLYQMERLPFKNQFWNTNNAILNFTFSFTSGISLWDKLLNCSLLKYVNLWKRQQIPSYDITTTYDKVKSDFFWF